VSRWLPETLCVALSPARVTLMRRPWGLRRAVARPRTVAAAPGAPANWHGALAALNGALAEEAAFRTDATVILSNFFVRYTLLPWSGSLGSQSEWDSYAVHRFASIHGAAAPADIRVSPAPKGMPRLASAVDPALIRSLVAAFEHSRVRLRSIQPWLMAALNPLVARLPGEAHWLVLREPGLVTLGLMRQGRLHHLRLRQFDPASGQSLADVITREARMMALEDLPSRVATAWIDDPAGLFAAGASLRVQDLAALARAGPDEPRLAAVH